MPEHTPSLLFHFPDAANRPQWKRFDAPERVLIARTLAEVRPALRAVQRAVDAGLWAAGYVAYEAAPAFDPALTVRDGGSLPLLWLGLFRAPAADAPDATAIPAPGPPWRPSLTRDAHADGIASIRAAIAAGDVYQVNHTLRLRAEYTGDPRALFHQLRRAQSPCYAADLDIGPSRILSASPELFFRRDGERIVTRPMKGTRPRGRWPDEDAQLAASLRNSPKDRAENVMIVDLLRNDLGKIARTSSVHVPALFTLERYPTVWQMTSTVEAALAPTITLDDTFAALFPCGSVTGAPKVSAMRRIATLEDSPRGVYCGAIGYVSPHGESVFSVAIRTLTVNTETHAAEYGVGGGITWDSTPDGEYDEALSKAALLTAETPEFSLLETMRLDNSSYFLLDRHIQRLRKSAAYFGFALPLADIGAVLYALAETHPKDNWRVRLTVNKDGQCAIQHVPFSSLPVKAPAVALADSPVSSKDIFLFHKTTHRDVYQCHRAAHPDAFDVLLYNELGELTEFTIGNLVLERGGELWTPPVACGLLAGTFRAALLERKTIKERVLTREDLTPDAKIWLINSVRGWVRVELDGKSE